MIPTGRQSRPVRPSSTDPVDAWLDVLVSMLGLPTDQRRTVRDELEDHLRSRIDDLLIAGRSEGEALRQAVAELGETADLARQITHAHANPRNRRFIMHALVLALVGTVIALGVSTVRPGAAPATADAPRAATTEPEPDNLMATTIQVTGGELNIMTLLERFAAELGLELEVDRARVGPLGVTPDKKVMYAVGRDTEVTLARALEHIMNAASYELWAAGAEGDRLTAVVLDGTLFVTTNDGYSRRTTERRVYDLGDLALANPSSSTATSVRLDTATHVAMESIQDVIQHHIRPDAWIDLGGDIATLGILGANMVITAPVSMHNEIDLLLGEVRANQLNQLESTAQDRLGQIRSIIEEADRVRQEYNAARDALSGILREIAEVEIEIAKIAYPLTQDTPVDAWADLRVRLENLSIERGEIWDRMTRLSDRENALRTRADQVSSESGVPTHQRSPLVRRPANPPGEMASGVLAGQGATTGLVHISGAGDHDGAYPLHAGGNTLLEILNRAGIQPPGRANVQILRQGRVITVVRDGKDIHPGPNPMRMQIESGDRITVAPATD